MNIQSVFVHETGESNTRALPPSDFVGSCFSSPRRSRSNRLGALTSPDNPSWSSPKKVSIEHHAPGMMEATISSRELSASKFLRVPDDTKLSSRTKKTTSSDDLGVAGLNLKGNDVSQARAIVPGRVSTKKAVKRRNKDDGIVEITQSGPKEGDRERHEAPNDPHATLCIRTKKSNGRNEMLQHSRSESKIDPPGLFGDDIVYATEVHAPSVSKTKVKRSTSKRDGNVDDTDKGHLVGAPRKRKEKRSSTKKSLVTESSEKLPTDPFPFTATRFPVTTAIIAADKEKLPTSAFCSTNTLTPKASYGSDPKLQQRRGSDLTSTTQTSSTSRSGSAEHSDPFKMAGGRMKSPTRRQRTLSKGSREDALAWTSPRKAAQQTSGFLSEGTINCATTPKRTLSDKSSGNLVSPTKRTGRVSQTLSTRSRIEKSLALFESSPLNSSFDEDDTMTVMTWTRVTPVKNNSKSSLAMVAKKTSTETSTSNRESLKKQVKASTLLSNETGASDAFQFISRKKTGTKAASHNLLPLDFNEFQPEDFSTVEFDDPVVLMHSSPSKRNQAKLSKGHDSLWSLKVLHDG